MKIAVYSIACNEVHEVAGWEETTREADFRLLFDTGSTDGTDTELAKFPNVTIHRGYIKPWRFDDARNAALSMVPDDIDICISLDMDERLRGANCPIGHGWREPLLAAWEPGKTTMLRCQFNNGGLVYHSYRIHSRFGYRWINPVHEILKWRGNNEAVDKLTETFYIEHYPMLTKPRPHQRTLLEEAVAEAPQDARMALQFGWQLVVDGEVGRGLIELQRFLELSAPTGVDAAFVHRLAAKNDKANFFEHMKRAEAAYPATSNQIVLADYYREREMWPECYTACQAAIARERMRPSTVGYWGDDDRLRTSWLHDTASTAAWMCWDFEASYGHAIEAYRRNPDKSRQENVLRIEKHIANGATLENLSIDKPLSEIKVEIRRVAETETAPADEEAQVIKFESSIR